MAKIPTRRERILNIFSTSEIDAKFSCNDLLKEIIEQEVVDIEEDKRERYIKDKYYYTSGSISSLLRRMVVEGILKYSANTTKRGGHLYQLNKKD